MKTFVALPVLLAGSVMLAGCFDGDNDAAEVNASVRILHASPDAPAVDIAVDGDVILTGVAFQQGTGYLSLAAGQREVSILVGGTEILSEVFALDAGSSYSIIAQGPAASLALKPLDETARRSNGTIDVTVVHASPAAGEVDVSVTAPSDTLPTTPTLDNVPFGADATLESVVGGDYRVRVTPGAGGDVVYDSGTLPVAADVTAVAVNSTKGASPVSLLVWADSDTPVTPVLDDSAEVRIVRAVDAVTVDVYAGGALLLEDFVYQTDTGYVKVKSGALDVAVAPADQGIGNAVASLSGTLDLERGESYTVIAAGDVNKLPETRLIVLVDEREFNSDTEGKVRLVHASSASAADPVDIYVVASGAAVSGDPAFADVVFGQDTGYVSLPAATYDAVIAADGTTAPAVPNTAGLAIGAGDIFTGIAIGDASGLDAIVLDDRR